MPQTIDAATGQPIPDDPFTQAEKMSQPVNRLNTVPSLINIPPQIAVTVFWIAIGVGIGWWLFRKPRSGGGRFNDF